MIVSILWLLLLLLLITFIILVSIASTYKVVNCNQSVACEGGLSVTPDYTKRKNLLFYSNLIAWILLLGYLTLIIISPFLKSKRET